MFIHFNSDLFTALIKLIIAGKETMSRVSLLWVNKEWTAVLVYSTQELTLTVLLYVIFGHLAH